MSERLQTGIAPVRRMSWVINNKSKLYTSCNRLGEIHILAGKLPIVHLIKQQKQEKRKDPRYVLLISALSSTGGGLGRDVLCPAQPRDIGQLGLGNRHTMDLGRNSAIIQRVQRRRSTNVRPDRNRQQQLISRIQDRVRVVSMVSRSSFSEKVFPHLNEIDWHCVLVVEDQFVSGGLGEACLLVFDVAF